MLTFFSNNGKGTPIKFALGFMVSDVAGIVPDLSV